jgi:diacylglycerol kinase family enzyme
MQTVITGNTKPNRQAEVAGPSRAAVLVNLSANNSAGERKWRRIQTTLLGALPTNTKVVAYRPPFDLVECVRELREKEHFSCFIAAGGDGTLNRVLNAVLQVFGDGPDRPYLGAIGLGSRNNFHKPVQRTCLGIPIKIDMATTVFSDVGQVRFTTDSGECLRYFITGASMGLKAEANQLFNLGDPVIHALKHRFLNLTILYTAITTLLSYQNVEVAIQHNASEQTTELTNLSLAPALSDEGYLGFDLCYALTKAGRLRVLCDVALKRVRGPGRISMLVRTVSLKAQTPIPLATDGEIQLARSAIFSVAQNKIAFLC